MAVHKTVDGLIKAITARADKVTNPTKLREPLIRIGLQVTALAKLNIQRWGMIDTGRLLNSIKYELFQKGPIVGVEVGSYGVPYAAIHEFGGPFTEEMRKAMFASMRGRKTKVTRPSKGFYQKGRFPPRPYLRRALVSSRTMVIDLLRGAMSGAT